MKLKSFSLNFSKELVSGILGKKNMNLLKKQNDEDKDLLNFKVFFNNVKKTADQFIQIIENLLILKQSDLKNVISFDINSQEISFFSFKKNH